MKKKNEFIISVGIFLLLANFVLLHSLYSEELVKQKISIITLTEDFNSLFIESLLYSKLMETNEIIIQDTFGEQPTDFLFFMYQKRLSGLLVISNKGIMVYTTKGLITNISITNLGEVDNILSYLLSVYKPAPPEKIYKEIEKIDYISPLEETNLRPNLYLATILYQANIVEDIYTNDNKKIEKSLGQNETGLGISLGFGIDTRYISFGSSIQIGLNRRYYGISTTGGLWTLKGFLMMGLEIQASKQENSLDQYNNSIFSEENKISLIYMSISPIAKFKLDKTSSILTSLLIGFTATFPEGQLVKIDTEEYGPKGLMKFLCLKLTYEQGITDKIILYFSLTLGPVSTGVSYKLEINNTYYKIINKSVYGVSLMGLKYRF